MIAVRKIDKYLEGSPMAGLGQCIVDNARRTGIDPYLCPAQATAESSNGRQCLYPYQAWGMYGVRPSSWEDGVRRYFDNIIRHWGPVQSIYQMPGYCVPDHPYMENVDRIVRAIKMIEINGR